MTFFHDVTCDDELRAATTRRRGDAGITRSDNDLLLFVRFRMWNDLKETLV